MGRHRIGLGEGTLLSSTELDGGTGTFCAYLNFTVPTVGPAIFAGFDRRPLSAPHRPGSRPAKDRCAIWGAYGCTGRIVHLGQGKVLPEGTPHTELHRFRGSGHFLVLDEPEMVHQARRAFLDRKPGRSESGFV